MSKTFKNISFDKEIPPFDEKESTPKRKLRSPPPFLREDTLESSDHTEHEVESEINDFEPDVEITDIAEKKEEQMKLNNSEVDMEMLDDADKLNTQNRISNAATPSKVLVHTASFYARSVSPLCPPTPKKVGPFQKRTPLPHKENTGSNFAQEDSDEWDKEDQPDCPPPRTFHKGSLPIITRTDTKTCLIIPADWCLTPRKMANSPHSVEEEEEEEEDSEMTDFDEQIAKMDKESNEQDPNVSTMLSLVKEELASSDKMEVESRWCLSNSNDEESTESAEGDLMAEEDVLVESSEEGEKKEDTGEKLENWKKDQTEHRLVNKVTRKDQTVKVNTLLVTVPLVTIRKRRNTRPNIESSEDILNYV